MIITNYILLHSFPAFLKFTYACFAKAILSSMEISPRLAASSAMMDANISTNLLGSNFLTLMSPSCRLILRISSFVAQL